MLSDWKSGEATILEPDKFVEQKWTDFDHLPEPLFMPRKQLLRGQFIDEIKAQLKK